MFYDVFPHNSILKLCNCTCFHVVSCNLHDSLLSVCVTMKFHFQMHSVRVTNEILLPNALKRQLHDNSLNIHEEYYLVLIMYF